MPIPDGCCIRRGFRRCSNPPSHIISIIDGSGEYMVGVVCREHLMLVESIVGLKQMQGEVPEGSVRFTELKSVATTCNYTP
ncbi:MAG: hypothetical protein RMJ59_03405 [Candidatus Nitrosocaldus sp.]|nr:hypothetical protein [Candidatus Nitrosocaldus sp.]MCS7140980.1 hypothetical protein [Candidatus Nitrosocaldus sp.]MDW7999943.1 hypothetical protein [Candidatus Nitrosocaldus sp.]MDW8275414.1 hypothetical protein [Candidatus Nitrosocaldus sp.]